MRSFNVTEDREIIGANGLKVIFGFADGIPEEFLFSNGQRTIERIFEGDESEIKAKRKEFRESEAASLMKQASSKFGGEWGRRITRLVKKFSNSRNKYFFEAVECRTCSAPGITNITLSLSDQYPADLLFSNYSRRFEYVVGPEASKDEYERVRREQREKQFARLKQLAASLDLGENWTATTSQLTLTISQK